MLRTLDSVLRLERPLIGLDLETTGTNRQHARIVQLGLEIFAPGKPTREWKTLVNPEEPIPPGATKVHGITDDMVQDAPTFKQLMTANGGVMVRGLSGCDFAGTNVRFDLEVLSAEMKRASLAWDYEGAYVIDSYRLEQIIKPRSLVNLIAEWLEPLMSPEEKQEMLGDGHAHDALWDTRMSTRVIAAQLDGTSHLPRTARELHELCSPGWFDAEGKLKWRDGELCLAFGAHKDRPLREVPRQYLTKFIQNADFSEKVKKTCADAARGVYPVAPATVPAEE